LADTTRNRERSQTPYKEQQTDAIGKQLQTDMREATSYADKRTKRVTEALQKHQKPSEDDIRDKV
jgi:hypothetical protein